jgi:tellurite resistance protein TehA-like permease
MYFVVFICVVLIVKAILRLTMYKDDNNFSYYDNISNIFIGVVLFAYTIKMMRDNSSAIALPSVFETPNVSPIISTAPSISDFSESTK